MARVVNQVSVGLALEENSLATLQELEQLNDDELRELANQNMDAALDEQAAASDAEGAEEAEGEGEPQEEQQQATQQPTVYRRVIDLGDGSGTQVFEGATQDELIDKLTKAQEHASRKIRELSTVQRESRQQAEDNNYLLSQELLSNPTDAFKKMFEGVVGMPIDSFKSTVEKVKAFERGESARTAAVDFVNSTPEYYDVEANGKKIGRFLTANKLEWTSENMKKAFEELNADGLLVQRPQAPNAGSSEGSAAPPRIAAPAQPAAPVRRAGSNISPRGRSVAPPARKKLSEADIYAMDINKLEDLANRELKGELVEE